MNQKTIETPLQNYVEVALSSHDVVTESVDKVNLSLTQFIDFVNLPAEKQVSKVYEIVSEKKRGNKAHPLIYGPLTSAIRRFCRQNDVLSTQTIDTTLNNVLLPQNLTNREHVALCVDCFKEGLGNRRYHSFEYCIPKKVDIANLEVHGLADIAIKATKKRFVVKLYFNIGDEELREERFNTALTIIRYAIPDEDVIPTIFDVRKKKWYYYSTKSEKIKQRQVMVIEEQAKLLHVYYKKLME